jgi:imidazoleglycerol phosphate synthase glutamine amidotransferase subunit HisH
VQFDPLRSGAVGKRILAAFVNGLAR